MEIQLDAGMFIPSFLFGLTGTLAMTVVEIPIWKRLGLRGVLEWHENQILSTRMFRLSETSLHIKGILLLHFVNGGLGGMGFALVMIIFPFITSNLVIVGVAYGVFLWFVTLIPIHKPITGIIPWKHPDGNAPMITSLIGHTVYGIVVGLLFSSI